MVATETRTVGERMVRIPPEGFHAYFLPPANEVFEGYVFTRVYLSAGGIRLSAWWDSPPRQGRPLLARQTPPGKTDPLPSKADPPPPGEADTAPRQDRPPPPPPRAVNAGGYGQQAGGMHSAGMQSCSDNEICLFEFSRNAQ